jgi:hypothetical protein
MKTNRTIRLFVLSHSDDMIKVNPWALIETDDSYKIAKGIDSQWFRPEPAGKE